MRGITENILLKDAGMLLNLKRGNQTEFFVHFNPQIN